MSALLIAGSTIFRLARLELRKVERDLSKQMKFLLLSAIERIEDVEASNFPFRSRDEYNFSTFYRKCKKEENVSCIWESF